MNEKLEVKDKYDRFVVNLNQNENSIKELHNEVSLVLKYFRQRKIATALNLGGFKSGGKVLEVGSNVGQNTTMLARYGLRMVGIDISDKAVEMAKKNAALQDIKNVAYFPQDVEDLNLFKEEVFDGVVSFSALRYVPDLKKALNEIYRVTKKGGTVVLDFPNRHCPWFALLKNRFGVENHIHDHFYTVRELEKLFKETGFINIETKKILFTHYTFPDKYLSIYKAADVICEHTFLIKELAAIVFCKGVKR